jgi:hypothetical protein
VINAATGRAGEIAAGIVKNTERIESATGTAAYRIPDALNHIAQVLTEVKNVAKLGLTSQLEDFIAYAAANGYKLELIIRSDTKITPALQDALDAARLAGVDVDIIRSLP